MPALEITDEVVDSFLAGQTQSPNVVMTAWSLALAPEEDSGQPLATSIEKLVRKSSVRKIRNEKQMKLLMQSVYYIV